MRKLPAVLALYQTDECMDMIAEVLEDRNAFSVTYIPLDSEDILPRSADIDPDILLLEISPAVSVREIRPAVGIIEERKENGCADLCGVFLCDGDG